MKRFVWTETKDKSEEKVENGSSKRKSEAGEGDGPDSTDITPKKVKVDETSDAVAEDGDAPQLEATVWDGIHFNCKTLIKSILKKIVIYSYLWNFICLICIITTIISFLHISDIFKY